MRFYTKNIIFTAASICTPTPCMSVSLIHLSRQGRQWWIQRGHIFGADAKRG